MPKRAIEYAAGYYYHIFNRGVERHSIFRKEENYIFLLRRLKQVLAECNVTMIAYALLPNHYHWLIRQDGIEAAGRVPMRVFGSYTQAFNKSFARTGTLFEGPYKMIRVESDDYLRHLCRYIHANPVRHGIAFSPDLWPYSNYLEWIGSRAGTLFDPTFIQTHFGTPNQYAQSMKTYLLGHEQLPPGLRNYLTSLA
jgi:putative transposase